MMTNKERSAAIRAEIKKLGYNSKQVSVRSRDCGYSDYTDITVKDITIKIDDIISATRKFEKISYDEYSMEILQGCNTYINVRYDYDALKKAEDAVMPKVEEMLLTLPQGQVKFSKGDSSYVLYADQNGFYLCSFKGGSQFGNLEAKAWTKDEFKWNLARCFVTKLGIYK